MYAFLLIFNLTSGYTQASPLPLASFLPQLPCQTVSPMGSSMHWYVTCLPQSLTPLISVSHWGFYHLLCRSHAFRKASDRVDLRTSFGVSFCHDIFLHRYPPSNPFYCAKTSNIGLRTTHYTTIPCLQLMYVATIFITASLNTSLASGVSHILFINSPGLLPHYLPQ